MKILAIENEIPCTREEECAPHLESEAIRAWELYQSGFIREMHFRAHREEAILMIECSTLKEAESVLNTFPPVKAGLIAFDVIPIRAYPGFARLLHPQSKGS